MQKCKQCGSELYLGKDESFWCPHCKNILPLSKEEGLKLCDELVNISNEKIENICKNFSCNDMIFIGTNSRELKCVNHRKNLYMSWDVAEILCSTFIIKRALSGSHGDTSIINCNNLLVPLYQCFKDLIFLENGIILIQEEYGSFFEYSIELIKLYKGNKSCLFEINGKKYMLIYKSSWRGYLKILEKNNICRKERLVEVASQNLLKEKIAKLVAKRGGKRHLEKFKDRRKYGTIETIYNALHSTYYDPEIFSFVEIDNHEEVLAFLGGITTFARNEIKDVTKSAVTEISKEKFFELAGKYDYDSNRLYNMFVSKEGNIKNFPIMVEHNNNIFLCPETMFLVWCFLKYKLNRESINNILTGDGFEDHVKYRLNELGISTKDPLNEKLSLKGRKIKIKDKKENSKERQVDIIGYNDSTIFIIECKDWSLSPKLLWRFQQEYRVRDIKKEIDEKHIDRINFVKQNYKPYFGFKKDYKVKGVVVTRIKERIQEYKDVKILCESELDNLT